MICPGRGARRCCWSGFGASAAAIRSARARPSPSRWVPPQPVRRAAPSGWAAFSANSAWLSAARPAPASPPRARPVSPDTVLRLVHRAVAPLPPTPRVLAVDDWAWRRGQNYGTILVDLERNAVVDLLPDREVATLSAWLQRHGGIQIVARDRATAMPMRCG